eukprot:10349186-Alexandrium_andersonii.AAC.1
MAAKALDISVVIYGPVGKIAHVGDSRQQSDRRTIALWLEEDHYQALLTRTAAPQQGDEWGWAEEELQEDPDMDSRPTNCDLRGQGGGARAAAAAGRMGRVPRA